MTDKKWLQSTLIISGLTVIAILLIVILWGTPVTA